MGIQNPHDKFFKEIFGNVEVAEDFFTNYLPQSILDIIDLKTIELQKDSFINKDLEESFSDLLFKVNINNTQGYIYFLFEHKSYPSKDIAFQLLKYMIEIWETKVRKEQLNKLPIIIPLVIYHGKERWKASTALKEMINGYDKLAEDVKIYIPNYEYLLYDISRFTDEEIKGKAQLKIFFTTVRDIFTKSGKGAWDSIDRAIAYLKELEDKQTATEYFETLMRYIFSVDKSLTSSDANEIIKRIETTYPEGSEVVMTLAEKLREEGLKEGLEKGLEEGLEKGKVTALAKTALKLLSRKFGPLPEELKSKISKLDAVTLEVIIDGIFDYESLDDVKKYIK
ncbi:transposase [Tepidanaerobacter syntrophicus]|uniref:Rpn family recombination-promoting nuclease/putative transposase n=1 Tax=Tepidanaerobacter syntrophicus TaxID=224999 RepID=UPI0022EE3FCB|nr:Rpn family recombination-promoting nuclease/putative transposase [Tepidanaerobacter syntrophicus]GLI51922.1 transposase [Tepidanaerobacter syntrophicus]